ncbi:hypothetical protein T02_2840 [Trichinella nativa]|uniref:Uncharacterized protein n=1 Tax=Trichinella nativa TaxID=6335 RepID=A0A0V1L0Z6_9BILA|nr:hypothetical protein T02_2840 [Trichinella nativa]
MYCRNMFRKLTKLVAFTSNMGGVCIVINSLKSELRSSKAICSLDRWSSKAISRRQGNATDKKSTMPIPLLTTNDRSVVNNSGRLLIG